MEEETKGFGGFIEQLSNFSEKELKFGNQTLKLGEVMFLVEEKEALKVRIENKKIDISMQDKLFLRDLLKIKPEERSPEGTKNLKVMAEKLKKDGTTVSISYQGQTLLKLGLEAKPNPMLRLALRSDAIEMDMGEWIRLFKDFNE